MSATRVESGLWEEQVESVQMEPLNQPHVLHPCPVIYSKDHVVLPLHLVNFKVAFGQSNKILT